MKRFLLVLCLLLAAPAAIHAAEEPNSFVNLPLADYNRLLDASRDPRVTPREAPTAYAVGKASLDVAAAAENDRIVAVVRAQIEVRILEDEWTAVPILPAGTAVSSATADGQPVELSSGPSGLIFTRQKAGRYNLHVLYQVDAQQSERSASLAIPVPYAAATTLRASLPGRRREVSVIPAAGTRVQPSDSSTIVEATIPSTTGVTLNWLLPHAENAVISRALYRGELRKDAIVWKTELSVEVAGNDPVTLPLMPQELTLREVRIDEQPAPLQRIDRQFATRLQGKGTHTVTLEFQTPFDPHTTPQSVSFPIPEIPISQFEFTLPGKKDVIVQPAANVARREEGDRTTAQFYVPLTNRVALSWSEAVPKEIEEELRMNASVIHTFMPEEGVLAAVGYTALEITRGELNALHMEIPGSAQINRVLAGNSIADWRIVKGETDILEVFFNHGMRGNVAMEVHFDRSLVGSENKDRMMLPLLKVRQVQRQRGMVALLAGKELTLRPLEERAVTKVGENQLPADIRRLIDKTIAHTYKYVEDSPELVVQAVKPERTEGRFDAEVQTLISLSDVSLRGAATIDLNVKSGSVAALKLRYPAGVNVLNLTAPSLRTYKLMEEEGAPFIDVQFTQEMEGQFRVELTYEQIASEGDGELQVPTISVDGAEVEQGRLAVEALTAVEVAASRTERLSSLELGELPQQLVLKTSNPILLAFKYVQSDPPPRLSLRVTKHKEVELQSAAIEDAQYRTLITEDGLAVTIARFFVRNTSQQFLKVELPEGSTVWSALVDGAPEKPALAVEDAQERKSGGPNVLLKIIRSTKGFPVELMYQTPIEPLGHFGRLDTVLPRPAMVVTHTGWELFLPDSKRYAEPETNLIVLESHVAGAPTGFAEEVAAGASRAGALQMVLPESGLRFTLKKLYANQSADDAYFSIAYTGPVASGVVYLLIVAATALFWTMVAALLFGSTKPVSTHLYPALLALLLVGYLVGFMRFDYLPALIVTALSLLLGIGLLAGRALRRKNLQQEAQVEG